MNNEWISADGKYSISTDPDLMDIPLVHDYLSNQSYWAKGIPKEVVERSIKHSISFGIYQDKKQIGFARVVSDHATFAYLADVFILDEYRGQGLSKWLMEVIHSYPELQGLRRWLLGTRDAHGLYEKFGWTVFTEDIMKRFMQKHDPNVYSN